MHLTCIHVMYNEPASTHCQPASSRADQGRCHLLHALQASRLELIDLMILADKAERQRPAAPPAAAVADDEFGDNDDMGYFAWDEGWTADCVMALSQPVSMAEAEATTELLACVADGHYPTW